MLLFVIAVVVMENAKLFRSQYYLYFKGLSCCQLDSTITTVEQVLGAYTINIYVNTQLDNFLILSMVRLAPSRNS